MLTAPLSVRLAVVLAAAWVVCLAETVRADVTVRWLGVAGFTITSGETTIAIDPFFSRPSLARTLFRRYVPDESVLKRLVASGSPAPELANVTTYLVGHSHYDHLGDVPWLAARRPDGGARVVGSATTAAITRGYQPGLTRIEVADPGAVVDAGAFGVHVFASAHGEVLLGSVPFPGTMCEPPAAPIHAFSFVLGDARGYLVIDRATGLRIVHLSSAGYDEDALAEIGSAGPVDLLLPAIQGRPRDFASVLVRALRPRLIVPHHFDRFFTALDDDDPGAPSDERDLAQFERDLQGAAAEQGVAVEVRRPTLFGTITVSRRSASGDR